MPVKFVRCKTAASPSRLPGLAWAINPFRGCAHACAYCYAQDVTRFELSKPWGEVIEVKVNIVQNLKKELEKRARGTYGVGTVTDPYQSLEKKLELTRGCLAILKRSEAETSILTKSDLVLRDLDILKEWPSVEVGVSLASLDDRLAGILEPGAPSPKRRLEVLRRLSEEGVRTYLMAAPIVRGLSDSENDLRSLVREVSRIGVRVMMWDKFNTKPMAVFRLRRRLAENGLSSPGLHSHDEALRIRSVLASECSSEGVELLDAF